MKCVKCGLEIAIHAKGKCYDCYHYDYRNSPERRAKHRILTRDWYLKNKDRHRANMDKYFYKIPKTLSKELRSRSCEICGSRSKICIDHDHATGRIRGALCLGCNTGIGCLEKPDGWLGKALSYLEKHKSEVA